jgi:hypothetical protein
MQRTSTLAAVLVALSSSSAAACVEFLADTAVDFRIDDCVEVSGGATLELLSGGEITGSVDIGFSSRVRVSGGLIPGMVDMVSADLEVTAGSVGAVCADSGSDVNVNGGSVGSVWLIFASALNLDSGTVAEVQGDAADVNVRGGAIGTIDAGFDTLVLISGGMVGRLFASQALSRVTVLGGNLGSAHFGEMSRAELRGGRVLGAVDLVRDSIVSLSGIEVDGAVRVSSDLGSPFGSRLSLSGGAVRGGVVIGEGSEAEISGGDIGIGLHVDGTADVRGTDLVLSRHPVLGNVITGRLADGTSLGSGLPFSGNGVLLFNGSPPVPTRVALAPLDAEGNCGNSAARVLVTHACAVQGFSLGVAHDPGIVEAVRASPSGAVAALRGGQGPEFFSASLEPLTSVCDPPVRAGVIVSMVASLSDPEVVLPPGTDVEVLLLEYRAAPGASAEAASPLAFVDCLRTPAETEVTACVLSCGTNAVYPEKLGSEIFVRLPCFSRGDCNGDGTFNISDPIRVLNHLFRTGVEIECRDSCDADDDGRLQITDAIRALGRLFLGGAALPAPFPNCGADEATPGDPLGCDVGSVVCG